jgi:hypothetical protein
MLSLAFFLPELMFALVSNVDEKWNVYGHAFEPSNDATRAIFKQFQRQTSSDISLQAATSQQGLLPPSSTHTFLSHRPNLIHVLWTNHQTNFTNNYFASPMDQAPWSTVLQRTESLKRHCDLASTVGRSVYAMAGGSTSFSWTANCTLVWT